MGLGSGVSGPEPGHRETKPRDKPRGEAPEAATESGRPAPAPAAVPTAREQLRTAGASRDPPCIAHTALGDGRAGKHAAEQQAEGRRTGVVPEEELGGGGGAWKGPPR